MDAERIKQRQREARIARAQALAAQHKAEHEARLAEQVDESTARAPGYPYTQLKQNPSYYKAKPYKAEGYAPSTGTRIRNVFSPLVLGWGDELEAAVRAPFSDRSYKDIQRELEFDQRMYRINDPAEAATGELLSGLTGGVLGAKLLSKLTRVPEVAQFASNNPNLTSAARNVALPTTTGAVMGAGFAPEGQKAEGAVRGGLLNPGIHLGTRALTSGGRTAVNWPTKDRFPGTDIGVGDETIPLGALNVRHPDSGLSKLAKSAIDRMLGSEARERGLRISITHPERLLPDPVPGQEATHSKLVEVLRNRDPITATAVLKQMQSREKNALTRGFRDETYLSGKQKKLATQQLDDTKTTLNHRIGEQKRQRQAEIKADQLAQRAQLLEQNKQRMIVQAVPPGTDPQLVTQLSNNSMKGANDDLYKLWTTKGKDSPWSFLDGRAYVINPTRVIDDAVDAAGVLGTAEKAAIRRDLQASITEIVKDIGGDLGTLSGQQLMQARNMLRIRARKATDSVQKQSYIRAAEKLEQELRAGLPADVNKRLDKTLTSYGKWRLYDDSVGGAVKSKSSELTPDVVLKQEMKRNPQEVRRGVSKEANQQDALAAELRRVDDAAEDAIDMQSDIATRRTNTVKQGVKRRKRAVDATKVDTDYARTQAKDAAVDDLQESQAMESAAFSKMKSDLDEAIPERQNIFAANAASGLALSQVGQAGNKLRGSPPGMLAVYGLGRTATGSGVTRAVAGQTAPQKYIQRLLRSYDKMAGPALSQLAGAGRRQFVMRNVQNRLPLEEEEE